MKPLVIELFAGLFGWGAGFVAEGYRSIGFDIVKMGPVPEGCELVLQDVLTLHGSQFRDAAVIVASPPCQAYSYRAMPWKRAKALPPPSNELFDACFRIQREASEAAGRYIPLVVENVKGAQPWVGRAKWRFGSFYLWGDVPALMPHTFKVHKVPGFRFDGSGRSFQSASVAATKNNGGSWFAVAHNTESGHSKNSVHEGVKNRDADGYERTHPDAFGWKAPRTSSRSSARKQASAEIAKIPFALAEHIAKVYRPVPMIPVAPVGYELGGA